MNKKNSFLLVTAAALFSSVQLFSYSWTMNNFTTKTLLVQIELLSSKSPYFVIIEPKQSADFSWPTGNAKAGLCLGQIKYCVANQYLYDQPGLIKGPVGNRQVIDNNKMLAFIDRMESPEIHNDPKIRAAIKKGLLSPYTYARKSVEIRFMPDELYNQTVAEAKRLTGTAFGAKIVGWFADMVAQSKCRSREISIVDKNGDIGFYTKAN